MVLVGMGVAGGRYETDLRARLVFDLVWCDRAEDYYGIEKKMNFMRGRLVEILTEKEGSILEQNIGIMRNAFKLAASLDFCFLNVRERKQKSYLAAYSPVLRQNFKETSTHKFIFPIMNSFFQNFRSKHYEFVF